MWHNAAKDYPRWTQQVHHGEAANLNKAIHYENLRKQMTPETVKNFWINGYAVFHEIYDADTI